MTRQMRSMPITRISLLLERLSFAELDHLNGILYLDHLPHWQKYLLRHVDEWRRALRENPNAISDAVNAELAAHKAPR